METTIVSDRLFFISGVGLGVGMGNKGIYIFLGGIM